jgi:hypothetical protein
MRIFKIKCVSKSQQNGCDVTSILNQSYDSKKNSFWLSQNIRRVLMEYHTHIHKTILFTTISFVLWCVLGFFLLCCIQRKLFPVGWRRALLWINFRLNFRISIVFVVGANHSESGENTPRLIQNSQSGFSWVYGWDCSSSCFGRLQVIMATMVIKSVVTYAEIIFNCLTLVQEYYSTRRRRFTVVPVNVIGRMLRFRAMIKQYRRLR